METIILDGTQYNSIIEHFDNVITAIQAVQQANYEQALFFTNVAYIIVFFIIVGVVKDGLR